MPKDQIDLRIREAARILQLEDNLDRKPGQLGRPAPGFSGPWNHYVPCHPRSRSVTRRGRSHLDFWPLDPRFGGTSVVGRFSPRSQVRIGDQVKVAVDTSRLNFFDVDTRLAIWD